MEIKKRGRYWAILDDSGRLVLVGIYRRGALEIIRKQATEGRKENVYKMERYR